MRANKVHRRANIQGGNSAHTILHARSLCVSMLHGLWYVMVCAEFCIYAELAVGRSSNIIRVELKRENAYVTRF